ncbi:MAG: phosphoribosylanthranilate isomerase [Anaerolineae bacterium]|nr:phosphoribosylanthranilate isomerase [Anaerolineae bacterium]
MNREGGSVTYVKICGITNLEDARCAAGAGADFLGFILYVKSPRYIAPEPAGDIRQAIRAEFGESPRCVGVFVDEPADTVRAIMAAAHLDLAQLHSVETPDIVAALAPRAFKALRPQTLAEAQEAFNAYGPPSLAYRLPSTVPDLLVDAYHPQQMGGTGQIADLEIARWLAERCRLLLAGGLTPDNVADAIAQVHPWGVDVASGVEASKGKKDHAKVKAFIAAAKSRNLNFEGKS